MNEEEKKQLKSIGWWIVGGGLAGVIAYLAIFGIWYYFFQKAVGDLNETVDEVTADMMARSQARQQQQQLEAQRKAKQTLDQNTLCGLNNDTGVCVCIHRQTGQRISMQYDECVNRATSSSAP